MLTCAVVIVAALVLGGGTRGGLLSDVILQLTAIPLLMIAALWPWRFPAWQASTQRREILQSDVDATRRRAIVWPLLMLGATVLIPLVQLVPIPVSIVRNYGVDDQVTQLLKASSAAVTSSWSTISVAPHMTWQALLSLVPPVAVFFATVQLPHVDRRRLTVIILAIGVASVFIGLLQLAQGPESKLRFYEITNVTDAVGLFANRNHFSALLYCLTVMAGAWMLYYTRKLGSLSLDQRFEPVVFLPLVAVCTVMILLLAAQGMTRSRSGLGLTIAAVFGIFALALLEPIRGKKGGKAHQVIWLSLGVAVVFVLQFALYGILERFSTDPLADPRVAIARNTISAAKSYMPFGSGVGTFVPVYGMYEAPADAFVGAYVNRAHNEFLEIWLESGVFGPVIFGLFALWVLVRGFMLWRPANTSKLALGNMSPDGFLIDQTLARAATLVVVLLIAHSFTDYPLRTGALSVLFAFATALMLPAPPDLMGEETTNETSAVDATRRTKRTRGSASRSSAASVAKSHATDLAHSKLQGSILSASGMDARNLSEPGPNGRGEAVSTPPPRDANASRSSGVPQVTTTNTVLSDANWPDAWRKSPPTSQNAPKSDAAQAGSSDKLKPDPKPDSSAT
jgi:O-antigen ligase